MTHSLGRETSQLQIFTEQNQRRDSELSNLKLPAFGKLGNAERWPSDSEGLCLCNEPLGAAFQGTHSFISFHVVNTGACVWPQLHFKLKPSICVMQCMKMIALKKIILNP